METIEQNSLKEKMAEIRKELFNPDNAANVKIAKSLPDNISNLGILRIILNLEDQDYLKRLTVDIITEIICIKGDFVTPESIKLLNSL